MADQLAGSRVPATTVTAPGSAVVIRAAELVELSERVYRDMFRAALWVAAATSLYALALVAVQVGDIDRPVAAAICIALASSLLAAARRHSRAYELLRRRPVAALAVAALLAMAHIVIGPGSQILFPPTLIIIGLLGTTVSTRCVFAAALLVAIAQASPALNLELSDDDRRSLITAAAADLFAPLLFSVLIERLARFMLDLHYYTITTVVPAQSTVVRGRQSTDATYQHPRVLTSRVAHTPPSSAVADTEQSPEPAPASVLTARQRQVLALISAGQRHAEIANCLAISTGQVTKHLGHARKRVGVDTTEQLVAWAVSTGLIPPLDPPGTGNHIARSPDPLMEPPRD